jgi:hypothetical protein
MHNWEGAVGYLRLPVRQPHRCARAGLSGCLMIGGANLPLRVPHDLRHAGQKPDSALPSRGTDNSGQLWTGSPVGLVAPRCGGLARRRCPASSVSARSVGRRAGAQPIRHPLQHGRMKWHWGQAHFEPLPYCRWDGASRLVPGPEAFSASPGSRQGSPSGRPVAASPTAHRVVVTSRGENNLAIGRAGGTESPP